MSWTRYLRFTRNSVQRLLSYRANVLLFIFGSLTQVLVLYYLWKAVFAGAGGGRINGFTFPEMAAYLLATVTVQSLIYGNADSIVADEIMDGSIAFNLARPVDYRARVFFDHLGESLYNFAAAGLPALAAALAVQAGSGAAPGAGRLAAFALSLAMSFVLNFFYRFCVGLVAILTTNMWGFTRIEAVVANFLSGSLVPLAFFPAWSRGAIEVLPFASMVHAPVLAFAGKLEGAALARTLGIQAAWLAGLALLSGLAWDRLVRRLAVQGG